MYLRIGVTKALVRPSMKISSASPFLSYILFLINLLATIGMMIELTKEAKIDLNAKEV